MSTDPSTPANDANLSGLGRALLESKEGSKPSGPWVPPTAEELGKLLPEYDIVKMLGRGGMGAVYMGRQISLDRPVAIKILSNTLDEADASFAERFKNEARAMGKLNHPGIVAVHDFGQTASGLLYIVMEYVEGTDVARMIAKSGRLHTEHAMAITAHVCDALAYAHERGIIHRDIKPANIMVGYDGVVKVADFGLAKMTHSQNTGLTQSGMAMGTLHYMAPEALMLGSAVDHRADIYAVGVMLYQMLTGKIPQGMFKLPSLQIPGLDPRYDAIIAKGIMEDREARYQSVGEMRRDLDGILTQPVMKVEAEVSQAPAALPTMARPQRPGGQPYRPPQSVVHHQPAAKSSSGWIVWAVLGMLALGGAYFALNPANQKNHPSPDQTTPPQTTPPQTSAASTTTPEQATKDAPFVNSFGMKFVPVPGTKVLFCIHETRRQDYAAYASEVPNVDGSWKDAGDGSAAIDNSHPVSRVSWEDAKGYCDWLSKRDGKTYRLPTDREWSAAVGIADVEDASATPETLSAVSLSRYPWGNQWPPPNSAGNYAGDLNTDGFPHLAPVMSFSPSNLGIYDLSGNTMEWVNDWWNGEKADRVLRGGSFESNDGRFLLSSRRDRRRPGARLISFGFRVVIELPGKVAAPSTALTGSSSSTSIGATKDAPFVNTLGMKFVPVPGTQILMCIHETRRQDYAAYATTSLGVDDAWKNPQMDGIPFGHEDTHPVGGVNWEDAVAFCAWLSKKEGKTYRLPTDEEWSIAVGLGTKEIRYKDTTPEMLSEKETTEFPWGGDYPPKTEDQAGNYADSASHEKFPTQKFIEGYTDGFPTTAPVMSFKPNKLGLYDMGGNVWEWLEDWWNAAQKLRVMRGASFGDSGHLLSSSRIHPGPTGRSAAFGFRCVVESTTAPAVTVSSSPASPVGVMPQATAPATTPPLALDQLPDFRTRVANYQKARHTQLTELATKYRAALAAEKAAATKTGVLAAVTACDAAIANAASYAQVIEQNLTATEVKPLPALAAVADPAPPRLQELRDIFGREVMKIETTLVASLDQSLATVQASLTQAANHDAAKAVETYRQQVMAAFGNVLVEASATVSTPSIPTSATTGDSGFIDLFSPAERNNWKQCGIGGIIFEGDVVTTWVPAKVRGWGIPWYSKRMFSDFTLKVEFRGSQVLFNSGLRLRFPDPGNDVSLVGSQGYEIAIADSAATVAGNDTFSTGGIAFVQAPTSSPHRPQGEWNELEVTVIGQSYTVTLNGQIVNRFTGSRRTEGYVGLENHMRGSVQFRNMSIKDMGASASTPTAPASNSAMPSAASTATIPTTAASLLQATKGKPFVNSLGMKLVPVPGTKVLMCIHETRKGDFAAYAAEIPSASSKWRNVAFNGEHVSATDDHPVVMMNRSDAKGFCVWLSGKEGRAYRLPTDREWSCAVGLGDLESPDASPPTLQHGHPNVYPWGTTWPPPDNAGNIADRALSRISSKKDAIADYNDGHSTTAPVMSFMPNQFGIYDLAGNVWEWCNDNYNPHAALGRGTGWSGSEQNRLLASHRQAGPPNYSDHTSGFRVVLELP